MTNKSKAINPNNSKVIAKRVASKELQESTSQVFLSDSGTAGPIKTLGTLLEGYLSDDNLRNCTGTHIRNIVYETSNIMGFIAQIGDDNRRKEVSHV